MIPHIHTRHGVSVFVKGTMYEVDNSHRDYEAILGYLKENPPDAEDKIYEVITRPITAVTTAIANNPNSGVTFEDGVVKYNGQPIHNSLTERMLRMIDEGFSIKPLVNFLQKLMQNPSFRVVNHLYDFLQVGGIPITEDGDFLAYKAIRKDWKDIYSGSFDNSIGAIVQVPRNQVDENPDITSSYGLHVCSWNYLPYFAHADGRVVIVKVNPADVVAIPRDYNKTKMRVCRYEVVGEYEGYYEKDPHNLLASKSVFNTSQFRDPELGSYLEEEEDELADDYDSDDDEDYNTRYSWN
jgi:hypothetical protein